MGNCNWSNRLYTYFQNTSLNFQFGPICLPNKERKKHWNRPKIKVLPSLRKIAFWRKSYFYCIKKIVLKKYSKYQFWREICRWINSHCSYRFYVHNEKTLEILIFLFIFIFLAAPNSVPYKFNFFRHLPIPFINLRCVLVEYHWKIEKNRRNRTYSDFFG